MKTILIVAITMLSSIANAETYTRFGDTVYGGGESYQTIGNTTYGSEAAPTAG